MSSRFLFVLWDGGGNAVPVLAMAQRLIERGHAVRILSHDSLRNRIESTGAEFAPFRQGPSHDPRSPLTDAVRVWEGRSALETANLVRSRMLFGPAYEIALDTLQHIDEFRPQCVAVDYVVFGAHLAAEVAQIPCATIIPHVYPLPHAAVKGRSAFTYLFERLISGGLAELNKARLRLGLEPLASVKEQYLRSGRQLLTAYASFDAPGSDLPENVRYVGPLLPFPPEPAHGETRPVIVLSFSTAYQGQSALVERIANLLSAKDCHVVLLAGPALWRQPLSVAPSVDVREFAPHSEVLPGASLVITHAGHGTAIGALSHGLPLLCIPFMQDQFDIAKLVVKLGAGLELSHHAQDHEIIASVERLLTQSEFRQQALAARQRFALEDDPNRCVLELEALACQQRSDSHRLSQNLLGTAR